MIAVPRARKAPRMKTVDVGGTHAKILATGQKATREFASGPRLGPDRDKKKWRRHVADVIARLVTAMEPDGVVLGGGNTALLKLLRRALPARRQRQCLLRRFRAWEDPAAPGRRVAPSAAAASRKTKGA